MSDSLRTSTRALNVLSLFSGIGGLELGLERAGMNVVGQVEIDPFCREVLERHWPDVPRHDDVRTAAAWWLDQERPEVDVICGGFPCQPVSLAGKRRGQADARWGWGWMRDVIEAIAPRYVLIENVRGLLTAGFNDILADLAALGFDAEWSVVSACAVGAPHTRERLFVVGYTPRQRGVQRRGVQQPEDIYPQRDVHHWREVPEPHRVANGIPRRMDRLKSLGNAVVPQVAERIGHRLLALAAAGGGRCGDNPHPRGGIRWVVPSTADYWSDK